VNMVVVFPQCRRNLLKASSELNDRAHQFRLIEKRLLVRFKDRNPAPLSNLDLLLRSTHNQLMDLGNKVCSGAPFPATHGKF
jgi:Bardet-Biedl syndrome 9 protein